MAEQIDWSFNAGSEGDWGIGYVPNWRNEEGRVTSGTTIVSGFDLGQQSAASIAALKLSPTLAATFEPYAGLRGESAVTQDQWQFERSLDSLLALNRQATGHSPTTVDRLASTGGSKGPRLDAQGAVRRPVPGEKPSHYIATDTPLRLELDDNGRLELTKAVRASYLNALARAYDLSAPKTRFRSLPSGIQTGLRLLSWHRGTIWDETNSAYPFFAASRSDWLDTVDSLLGGRIYWLPELKDFRKRRRAEARRSRSSQMSTRIASVPKQIRLIDLSARRARTA
jgi:hypothetical protein